MDRRSIDRPDWHRILEKTMYRKPVRIDGHEGLAHILIMDAVREPLIKRGVAIVQQGYTWLQIALRDIGLDPVKIDGVYGELTIQAVAAYQEIILMKRGGNVRVDSAVLFVDMRIIGGYNITPGHGLRT